jgi:hypothetical protein
MADALEVIGGVVPVAAALGPAGQSAVARAVVAGAIACGHVDYYCDGADITFTLMLHNDLQTKEFRSRSSVSAGATSSAGRCRCAMTTPSRRKGRRARVSSLVMRPRCLYPARPAPTTATPTRGA